MSAPRHRPHAERVRVLTVELGEHLAEWQHPDPSGCAEAFTERDDVRDLLACRAIESTDAAGREHEPPLVLRVLHRPSGEFALSDPARPLHGHRIILDLRRIWRTSSETRESAILAALLAYLLPLCAEASGVEVRARRELAARVALVLRAALPCPVRVVGGSNRA